MFIKRKPNKQKSYSRETFSLQLRELWKSCSKSWIGIVVILSILSSIFMYAIKLSFVYGRGLNIIYNLFKWDSCLIYFFVLSLFVWVLFLNKKVFSPKNINNRVSRFKMTFDRIISQGHTIQFYWLVSCFFILFIFLSALMGAFDAFGVFPNDNNVNWNPLSLTYLLLTDSSTIGSILKTNTHVANIIAIICIIVSVLGTLLFTGLLVSVFSNFLQRRVDDYKQGRLKYNLSDHIVFIGYDELLPPLVKQCAEYEANKNKKIVVQTKLSTEQVREDISTLIADDSLFRNIIFYNGRRDSMKDLRNLDLDRASEIFVIGNRQNDNHDELNLQCLSYIREIIENSNSEDDSKQKTLMHILIEDHTEYSKMKFLWDDEAKMEMSLFNIYAIWAKTLIHAKYNYPKLENKTNKPDEGINIIIIGMSRYGSSIGIEAINTFKRRKDKTIITFVCDKASYEMDMFRARFSELFNDIRCSYNNFIDSPIVYEAKKKEDIDKSNLEIEFIDSNPFNGKFHTFIEKRKFRTFLFHCTEKNTKDINSALFMPQKVIQKSNLYILQKHGTQFVNKLDYYKNFYTFGSLYPSFDLYKYLLENLSDLYEKHDNYNETSTIYENQGNWNRALDYQLKAWELCKQIYGSDSEEYADDSIATGFLYERIDDYETAMNFFSEAYKIKKRIYGYNSLEIADLEIITGWCFIYQNDYIKNDKVAFAFECFGKAIDILESMWGNEPQDENQRKKLAEAYYGYYYVAEASRVIYSKPYYDKYLELNEEIKKE